MQLAVYLDHVGAALASKDGLSLARLLSLTKSRVDVELQALSADQLNRVCQQKLARFDAFAEVIAGMVQARKHIENQRFEDAYASQIASVMYGARLLSTAATVLPYLVMCARMYMNGAANLDLLSALSLVGLQQIHGGLPRRDELGHAAHARDRAGHAPRRCDGESSSRIACLCLLSKCLADIAWCLWLCSKADREVSERAGDEVHDSLRSAEQHLKKGFSMSANDRAPPEHNKKLGSLFIVNQLFKIYFKLNTIQLCRNLIRAVEGPAFPEFEKFNKSDKVTYQYYVGRISMFEDQYHKAEKCLDYAWKHCHQNKVANKRMILQFLVPVKLLLGVMPSPQLIEAYALHEYTGLTDAIRCGNLRLFNEYLDKYQEQFIQQGVYLLIEKLRLVVMRNLIKKVYIIRQSHQLRLQDFQQALEFILGETMEMDEIECILANLIFKGYVKGYMSHQKKILVVSKAQPFPSITEVSS